MRTTCRVEFVAGEPAKMTVAERDVLAARGLTGVRLSCQIVCDHDMTVRAISRLAGSGRKDAGHAYSPAFEPPPAVWGRINSCRPMLAAMAGERMMRERGTGPGRVAFPAIHWTGHYGFHRHVFVTRTRRGGDR